MATDHDDDSISDLEARCSRLRKENERLKKGAARLDKTLQDIFSGTWDCRLGTTTEHDCLSHCIELDILDAQREANLGDLIGNLDGA